MQQEAVVKKAVDDPRAAPAVEPDLLAAQTQVGVKRPLSYRDYMAKFEADAASFYRPEGDIPMRERWKAAWRGFWKPRLQR